MGADGTLLWAHRGQAGGWVTGDERWGREQTAHLKETEDVGRGFSTTWLSSCFFSEPQFLHL